MILKVWYFIFGSSLDLHMAINRSLLLIAMCKWFDFKTRQVGLSKIFDNGNSHLGCLIL